MNVKLLRKVVKHILAEPGRFYMPAITSVKVRDGEALNIHLDLRPTLKTRPYPECNTVGCIAGWACLLNGIPADDATGFKAADLLGLDTESSRRLFFGYGHKRFKEIWNGDGEKKTALLLAKRVEHFIKTKGKE